MSDTITREFEFVEGTSNKFWKITVEGLTNTVHYGRVGTAGQVQTKEFETAALAKTAGDKLIVEKLKKGYHETTSAATAPVAAAIVAAPKPVAVTNALEPEQSQVAADDTPSQPEPPAPAVITRTVNLTEEDYALAGLRPRPRRKLPPAPLFDREAVANKIIQRIISEPRWFGYDFPLSAPVSNEEATLWLYTYCTYREGIQGMSNQKRHEELVSMDIPAYDNLQDVINTIGYSTPCLMYRLLSPGNFARLMVDWINHGFASAGGAVVELIRTKILPYVSDDDLVQMRQAILDELDLSSRRITEVMMFLALLGEKDYVRQWVEAVPFARSAGQPFENIGYAILWLGDPEFSFQQFLRLRLWIITPTTARAWLAHAQAEGLALLANCLRLQYTREGKVAMVKTVCRVLAPETAPYLLDWQSAGTAVAECKNWFETYPALAAAGLVPVAAGSDKKRAALAIAVLKGLVKRAGEAVVRAPLQALPNEVSGPLIEAIINSQNSASQHEALSESETPPALRHTPDSKPRPGDLLPDELPQLTIPVAECLRRLSNDQFYTLLHALSKAKPMDADPYISAVRETATPSSRDAFAWALFQDWMDTGAPPKDKWKMITVGLLGSDQCALNLTPLIRQWPGEAQHARAVLGLECLEAIGTDTALMQINGIAQKVAFKGIKAAAVKCMEAIAKKRGFTRSELEDRIVPDCGLDERGSRIFDFGPRQFVLSINSDMKPVLRELKDGKPLPKLLSDLPKPNLKDEPTKSGEAVADWKVLKKQVSDTAKVQAVRLEQGMVTGRRWSPEEFDLLLVHHPLMTNIVRLLVWGAFGDDGKLIQSFRVTEDLTAADSSEQIYNIPEKSKIGVVHPLHLSDTDKRVWGEIWSDYELVPPFPQLGRPIYTLTPEEADVTNLKRFSNHSLPAPSLIYPLEKLAWMRGLPADAGGFAEHAKPFYAAGVTAIVNYDPGAYVGSITDSDDQTITEVYFIPKIYTPDEWWPAHKKRVPWKNIDPIVVSEVLSDLTSIVAKSK